MKKILIFSLVFGIMIATVGIAVAEKAQTKTKNGKIAGQCVTIQDGTLLTTDGRIITTGFDKWGYNYQGHLFNGMYCDAYRDASWCQPYKDVKLQMKWNDAWLSNKDCDDDGKLDRHYGYDSYIGSGAWLTNHQSGEYEGTDGEICKWNYFVKIVAVPEDANEIGGIWYAADGTEIGEEIWGSFATIQEVENDSCAGLHGLQYKSPAGAGFGKYNPKSQYTFIHYAKGYKPVKKVKPTDNSCYSFISKDMEWKVAEDYAINPTNLQGLTEDFVINTINSAISEWEKEKYSGFNIFGDFFVDYNARFVGDDTNTVSFGDYASDGVIAVCRVSGIFRGPPSSREITEFDVMFDTDFSWGDATANSALMDLQNIATHELGHALGLGDLYNSECNTQTMYGYSWYGDIQKRDLDSGDIMGLNILYGN